MNQEEGKVVVERLMQKYGCLPSIEGGGPALESFNALDMAQAIESELQRAGQFGFSKITIHMDLINAAELAKALRKG